MRLFLPLLPLVLSGAGAVAQAQPQPEMVPPQPPPIAIQVPNPPPRTGTPQEQIMADLNKFVANLNTDNAFMGNSELVYGAKTGYFGANEWAKNWKDFKILISLDDVNIDNINEKQVISTIRYHAYAGYEPLNELFKTRSNRGAIRGIVEKLTLRKVQTWDKECWQIVPPEKINLADPEIGLFAYVTYILAQKGEMSTEALPYVLNTGGDLSVANLKQLGLGAMQLAMDYDEVFAFAPQYMKEAVTVYLNSSDAWRIPGSQQTYSFNANLCGKSLASIDKPGSTVMFYEGENQQPIFRYAGKAAIAFADGNCDLLTPEQLKKVAWQVGPEKP